MSLVRHRGWLIALTGVMVLVSAAIANAQGPRRGDRGGSGGFGMMGGRGNLMMLLRSEQVQKEVGLSEEQKTKLNELSEKLRNQMREQFSGMQDLTPEQRRARFEEMREKMEKEAEARSAETTKQIAEILKPEQLMRAKQIQLQLEGPAALRKPEIAKALGLSKEQSEKLEKLATEAREKGQQLFEGMRGGPGAGEQRDSGDRAQRFAELREKGEKIRKDLEQQSMAVLTADQKAKLVEMAGKPFELDRSQLFQGRGDRQRGDGPRGDRERGDRNRGGQDQPRR